MYLCMYVGVYEFGDTFTVDGRPKDDNLTVNRSPHVCTNASRSWRYPSIAAVLACPQYGNPLFGRPYSNPLGLLGTAGNCLK